MGVGLKTAVLGGAAVLLAACGTYRDPPPPLPTFVIAKIEGGGQICDASRFGFNKQNCLKGEAPGRLPMQIVPTGEFNRVPMPSVDFALPSIYNPKDRPAPPPPMTFGIPN